jgi:RNA polymerase sigma factor (sigma-70 family)
LQEIHQINKLIDHFFRHEYGKIVSVLTKIFGTGNLDLTEDVVHESMIEAINHWQYNGIPHNPSAWLFKVSKNKALNILNREVYKREYAREATYQHLVNGDVEINIDNLLSQQEIEDDQLRMIFTCCHPSISPSAQVALALKTLCGFSIPEIANAFLTSENNINKRLVRARQKIREDKIPFEVPTGNELEKRLEVVLKTIYLLFNEGYNASTGNEMIRYELCEEAIRLAEMITKNQQVKSKQGALALQALMQLNASRFKARQDANGNILTLESQDRKFWDYALMEKGFTSLEKAAKGENISSYLILAAISANHCSAMTYEATDWKSILSLYNDLIKIDNSPIVLLNRAVAISKVNGPLHAISELTRINADELLGSYHYYYSTLAVFYIESQQFKKAMPLLEKAINLAPLPGEKSLLRSKLESCRKEIS